MCCSHVITTRSVLGIWVFENATHRTYYSSTLCLSSLPWLTSWVKQVTLTLHHEHHTSYAYASLVHQHMHHRACTTSSTHHVHLSLCICTISSYAYASYAHMHVHHTIRTSSWASTCAPPLCWTTHPYTWALQSYIMGVTHLEFKIIVQLMWSMISPHTPSEQAHSEIPESTGRSVFKQISMNLSDQVH
jgi:hypothetical protein